jgi:hypothetical protein
MTSDWEATEEKITCTEFHTFPLQSGNERHDRLTNGSTLEKIRNCPDVP